MSEGHASQDAKSGSPSEPRSSIAWQPFTPCGIAAFAKATFGRILILLSIVALLTTSILIWFLNTAWFPTVRAAIAHLPEQGEISRGQLNYPRPTVDTLADHRFLGFVLIGSQTNSTDLSSHIAVKFRRSGFEACSIFGCAWFPYPTDRTIEFNRLALEARWGAWEPVINAIAAVVVFLGLLAFWIILAFVYSFPPWITAWFKKRDLSWAGSWWICSAALMPGSLLFALGIWIYGLGFLDVLQFLIVGFVQFVLGWVCIAFGFRALPQRPPRTRRGGNPFAQSFSDTTKEVPPVMTSKERSTGDLGGSPD